MRRLIVGALLWLLVPACSDSHDDGPCEGAACDAGAGDGDAGPAVAACDIGGEPARCDSNAAQCAAFEAGGEYLVGLRVRDYTLDAGGERQALPDAEVEARLACLLEALEALGLDSRGSIYVFVIADRPKLQALLDGGLVDRYALSCADEVCAHCDGLDEAACDAEPFCDPYYGEMVDADRGCYLAPSFAECTRHALSCDDAETYMAAADASCWHFSQQCELSGFTTNVNCGPIDGGLPCDELELRQGATTSCYASCTTQIAACPSIDEQECHGLCDFVIAEQAPIPGCLGLSIAAWQCDLGIAWACDPEQNVVGKPVDQDACAAENGALEDADCR